MNRYRFAAIALAILMGFPALLAAQMPFWAQSQNPDSTETTAVPIARADSAFRSGELELSRSLYKQVFKAEPGNARALYQLGRLAPSGSKLAIKLFRRYILITAK